MVKTSFCHITQLLPQVDFINNEKEKLQSTEIIIDINNTSNVISLFSLNNLTLITLYHYIHQTKSNLQKHSQSASPVLPVQIKRH